jgi:hypothetical protein
MKRRIILTLSKLLGLGLLAVGLRASIGVSGFLVALTVAVAFMINVSPFDIAYAQATVAAVHSLGSPGLLLAELGVLVLLVVSLSKHESLSGASIGVGVTALLAAITLFRLESVSLIVSTMVVLGIVGLLVYGIHRYEKVLLGLVEVNA